MSAAEVRGSHVGIIGATGAVGGEIAELLSARALPIEELKLFATERGAAETVVIGAREYPVSALEQTADVAALDLLFLAAPPSVNADIIRANPGPTLIDLSGTFAGASSSHTLAAPGFATREQIRQLKNGGVTFSVPHPAAYALGAILKAIGNVPDFAAAVLMLGASAGGKHEINELMRQSADLLNARLDVDEEERQRAFNIFPADDSDEFSRRILTQAAILLGATLKLTMQVLSVPVFHGAALALQMPASPDSGQWAERLRSSPGILAGDEEEDAGMVDTIGEEGIRVNCRRGPHGVALWCLFDNARLAALTAIWIAESLSSGAELS